METIQNVNLFGETTTAKAPVDRYVLAERLKHSMSAMTLDQFVRLLTNDFNEVINYVDLSNGIDTCQRTSLLFNPHRLEVKTMTSKFSIFDALKTKSFIEGLARVTLLNKNKVSDILYASMQLGVNGIQYVNEFPPFVARDLLRRFGMNANSRILDPCAGWGGRMIGISIVSDHYECWEPSTKTFLGLEKLFIWIKAMNPNFRATIHHSCFEDSVL